MSLRWTIKNIFKAVAVITFFSVLTRVGGFIFRVFLSKTIGAQGMGLYQISMSVFSLMISITSSGLPLAVSKRVSEFLAVKNSKKAQGTITAAIIISVLFSLTVTITVFLLANPLSLLFADTHTIDLLLVLLPAVVMSSVYSAFRGGMWGKQSYLSYGLAEFLEQYIRIGVGVIMLQGVLTIYEGSLRAAMSLSIAYCVSSAVAAVIFFLGKGKLSSPKGHFVPLIKIAAPITAIRVSGNLLGSLIGIILPAQLIKYGMNKSAAISVIGATMGMTFPMLSLPQTITGSLALALVPELSTQIKLNRTDKVGESVLSAVKFSIIFGGVLVSAFAALGPDLMTFLFSNTLSGEILRLCALSMLPNSLCFITMSLLHSVGCEKQSVISFILSSVITLLCAALLPSFIGINAVVVGIYASAIAASAYNLTVLHKKIRFNTSYIKPLILCTLIIAFVGATTYFLHGLISSHTSVVFSLFVCGFFSVVAYCVLCMAFNMFSIAALVTAYKSRKSAKQVAV